MDTTTHKEPWDLAREEGKTVIVLLLGPMIGVFYPYRKTGDMYVAIKDEPVFCCQCEEKFSVKEFLAHVKRHNQARRKYPDVIIDQRLVEPANGVKEVSV